MRRDFPSFLQDQDHCSVHAQEGPGSSLVEGLLPESLLCIYCEHCCVCASAVFRETAADTCTDKCTCAGKGKVCGSTFDESCGLAMSTLYNCKGNGKTPTEAEVCNSGGGCTVQNGDDGGNPDPCTCPGLGLSPVCGSDLPVACSAKANEVYQCPGGSGTKPKVLAVCPTGTQCQKRPAPVGAICGTATCECKGDNEICSDAFDPKCGYPKHAVLRCTASGQPEVVKTCATTQSCVNLADGSACTSNDCKCPNTGTICGEAFPLKCKINTAALYTCTKGGDPVVQKKCTPGRCSATKASIGADDAFTPANDVCLEECTCSGKGVVSISVDSA